MVRGEGKVRVKEWGKEREDGEADARMWLRLCNLYQGYRQGMGPVVCHEHSRVVGEADLSTMRLLFTSER